MRFSVVGWKRMINHNLPNPLLQQPTTATIGTIGSVEEEYHLL